MFTNKAVSWVVETPLHALVTKKLLFFSQSRGEKCNFIRAEIVLTELDNGCVALYFQTLSLNTYENIAEN